MAEKQATRYFFLLLVVSVAVRLLYTAFGPMDLVEDEAYYWEWSRQLDWSYYSKGPMVAYLIAAFTRTLGVSEWALRLPSILMGGGTMTFVFLLTSRLSGSRVTGLLAAIILSCSPIFIAGSMMLTIDSPLVFFYMGACYFTWLAASQETPQAGLRYWILAGVSLGLGIMAKAAILFFVPSILLFLLFSPAHRHLIKTRGPWLCIGVGLLFFTPQLIWNAQHDWVMFKDFLFKGGAGREIPWSERNPFLFLISQAGVLSPYIFWLVGAGMYHCWTRRNASVNDNSKHGLSPEAARFLLAFTLPTFGFFFLLSFNVPINANWPIIAYLTGIIAGAITLRGRVLELFKERNLLAAKRLRAIALGGLMLGAVPGYGLFGTDFLHQFKLPNEGRFDPTNRLSEWEQFAEKIDEYRKVYEVEGPLFLSSKYYQETALMAFYLPDHPTTYCFEHRARKNQYYFLNDFSQVEGQNSLFVARREKDLRRVERAFDSVSFVGELDLKRGQNTILEYDVYFCKNFHGWTYKDPQLDAQSEVETDVE